MDADWDGPDSEEIIMEAVSTHGNRDAIAMIRATLQGKHDDLRSAALAAHVNTTLLVLADSNDCVNRAYNGHTFPEHTPLAQLPYNNPEQFASGGAGPLNELFPSGEGDEPECGFDALFWPPLLWAVRNNDVETCKVLLELGADPDYISPAGMTAVLAAVRYSACDPSPTDAVAIIKMVATDTTVNYLSPATMATLAASPSSEYTCNAERLPIVCVCITPDLSPSGAVMLAQALIDKNAVIPPELVRDLTPEWFPQSLINLLQSSLN